MTHLEIHSHFSLLAGTASIAKLADRAAAEGQRHLALTDSNALYGAVELRRVCRTRELQPVLGMTLTVAPDVHPGDHRRPGQVVLLAKNPDGYRSLDRLSSLIQGSAERETLLARGLGWDALKEHRTGLICLSGGRLGWTERLLRAGDARAAYRFAAKLAGIFDENAYLSLEIHHADDVNIAREITAIGARLGLPTVAVQPVYCLTPAEMPQLKLLAAIDRNCTLENLPPEALPNAGDPGVELHWLSEEEMAARFAEFPDALTMTGTIAAQCGDVLPDGKPIWPALDLPEQMTPAAELTRQSEAGMRAKFGDPAPDAVQKRLRHELSLITEQGFAPLFLVVADIVRFSKNADIPVGTRGSAANSLVAFCLGITDVDPIEHDLLFERFLNPARRDMPDIDLDFCSRRRERVLEFVRQKYGAKRMSLVCTISTMQPKSAVRETAKAYGLDEAAIKRLSAQLPRRWHHDPRRRDRRSLDDVAATLTDPRERAVLRAAVALVAQPHHLSVHPGGTVIAPTAITDFVAVQMAPKGFLITQLDHRDVEEIGLPKLDLLGISALTVLADAADLVRRTVDPAFRAVSIPLNDPNTAAMIAKGDTVGVFQCESTGARATLRKLNARTIRDMAVANAFFKPGPATGGMADEFVRRYRGEAPVSYLHPKLEPILSGTKGVLLFQEQVMRVATEIAGLTWAQANQIRKGMSKFRPDDIAQLRETFIAGCQQADGAGFSAAQAETLWEQVAAFAGYGFNQGHATAYAGTSYRMAYMKLHFPAQFFTARLATHGGFHHPAVYIAEARRLGLTVRGPHINFSGRRFSLVDDVLWMGLGWVRSLRRRTITSILLERKNAAFTGLRDFASRISLQKKELAHLIQCGALDGLGENRASMLADAEALPLTGGGGGVQLSLPLERAPIAAEAAAQRVRWELELLGMPVNVHPLDALSAADGVSRLAAVVASGKRGTAAGVRLPGWTGTSGFYFADREIYVVAKPVDGVAVPKPWQPISARGIWREDEFGNGYFQAEQIVYFQER